MNIEKYLKNKGIVRNKKQANGIMIGFILLCLVIIVLVSQKPNYDNNINDQSTLSAEEIELMELSIEEDFTEADRLFDELSNKKTDQ